MKLKELDAEINSNIPPQFFYPQLAMEEIGPDGKIKIYLDEDVLGLQFLNALKIGLTKSTGPSLVENGERKQRRLQKSSENDF